MTTIRYHATTTVRAVTLHILVDSEGVVIAGTEDHALLTGVMCDEKGDGRCYVGAADIDHNGVTALFAVEEDWSHGEVLEDLTGAIDAALAVFAYRDESYLSWLYRYDDIDAEFSIVRVRGLACYADPVSDDFDFTIF